MAQNLDKNRGTLGGVPRHPDSSSPDGLTHRLPYLAALDGIRACAVIAVVLFHAGWNGAHGGFLGVDVFFTLSGYLITSLLLDEFQKSGRVRLGGFWARRARRLMPAQIAMALVVVTFAYLSSPPGYFGNLVADALSAIFYVGNWHLVSHTASYFTTGAPPSLFTHAWSLAIEEQFYLVWPIVVWLTLRRSTKIRYVGFIALGGAFASFALTNALLDSATTNRLYYGTDTHAGGILVGAFLGTVLWQLPRTERVRRVINPLSYLALGVLGLTIFMARGTNTWVFEFGFAVVALATSLLIASVSILDRHPVTRLLSWGPLTYLGRLSYGIYLWHYPVIALITNRLTHLQGASLFSVRLALTGLLAVASYHLVELPLRRSAGAMRTRRVLSAGVVAIVMITAIGATAQRVPSYPTPTPVATVDPVAALILGDSVMLTLDYATAPWRAKNDVLSTSATVLGCGIGPSFRPIFHGHLIYGNAKCHLRSDGSWLLEAIWASRIATERPDVVVVGAGRWETHDHRIGEGIQTIDDRWFQIQMRRGLDDIWKSSQAVGSNLLLLTTPCTQSGETKWGHPWPEDSPQRRDKYNSFLRSYAATHRDTSVLDVGDRACPGGNFSYFDPTGRYMTRNADGVHFGPGIGPLFGNELWSQIHHVGSTSRRWNERHALVRSKPLAPNGHR